MLLVFAVTGLALTIGQAGSDRIPGLIYPLENNAAYLESHVSLQNGVQPAPHETPTEVVADAGAVAGSYQYTEYEIQPGDTLNAIAEAHGVTIDYLIWNNPEVGSDPDTLIIGESLLVPGTNGLVYDVRLGDTITDIAGTYGVSSDAIIQYAPNALDSPDLITEGMVLVLPGGVPPAPPPEPEPIAPPVQDPPVLVEPDDGFAVPAAIDPPVIENPVAIPDDPSVFVSYMWPVPSQTVWSYYGPRWGSFHKGIDIAASYGEGVNAAASGQVVLATYRDNGYGMYVIVHHADGSETLYAHLSAIYVSVGQYVNQGDYVGAVGCTGWCSGDHLHFEVWIGGTTYNPLNYLP